MVTTCAHAHVCLQSAPNPCTFLRLLPIAAVGDVTSNACPLPKSLYPIQHLHNSKHQPTRSLRASGGLPLSMYKICASCN